MKVRLSFKTPDVVDYAVEELAEEQREEAKQACEKWVDYGECLTVEIDTEKGTCEVIPV
jgi:hypothetical protein